MNYSQNKKQILLIVVLFFSSLLSFATSAYDTFDKKMLKKFEQHDLSELKAMESKTFEISSANLAKYISREKRLSESWKQTYMGASSYIKEDVYAVSSYICMDYLYCSVIMKSSAVSRFCIMAFNNEGTLLDVLEYAEIDGHDEQIKISLLGQSSFSIMSNTRELYSFSKFNNGGRRFFKFVPQPIGKKVEVKQNAQSGITRAFFDTFETIAPIVIGVKTEEEAKSGGLEESSDHCDSLIFAGYTLDKKAVKAFLLNNSKDRQYLRLRRVRLAEYDVIYVYYRSDVRNEKGMDVFVYDTKKNNAPINHLNVARCDMDESFNISFLITKDVAFVTAKTKLSESKYIADKQYKYRKSHCIITPDRIETGLVSETFY